MQIITEKKKNKTKTAKYQCPLYGHEEYLTENPFFFLMGRFALLTLALHTLYQVLDQSIFVSIRHLKRTTYRSKKKKQSILNNSKYLHFIITTVVAEWKIFQKPK